MSRRLRETLHVAPEWQPVLARHGLDTLASVLGHGGLRVWRDVRERQNATIDLDGPDGPARLHVKRLRPGHGDDAAREAGGLSLLIAAGIATTPLVSWGASPAGGVLITRDLAGYTAGDTWLRGGRPFAQILGPTADLAARLHEAGLHHRDLYPCHFFLDARGGDAHLIDAARVRRLPRFLWRRWVVKDLAQFSYGAAKDGATADEVDAWLAHWAAGYGTDAARWRPAVLRKAARIARHDASLAAREPGRDVTLG